MSKTYKIELSEFELDLVLTIIENYGSSILTTMHKKKLLEIIKSQVKKDEEKEYEQV